MKCTDLMVGDWAFSPMGYPVKVASIAEGYASFDNGEALKFQDCFQELIPIILTAELFVKNDWDMFSERNPNGESELYFTKDVNGNYLKYKCGNLSIWINYKKKGYQEPPEFSIHCEYVHQLQQSLRLAYLNDLANNFKIWE